LTSRPAKLKISNKPHIQVNLNFTEATIITTNKRGNRFYEAPWKILEKPIQELYKQYNEENEPISYGSFLALKLFYIRGATHNDIEMCCCKHHLHARWAVKALVKSANQQNIAIDFDTYETFFHHLDQDCASEDSTYISWECVKNKSKLCNHITARWNLLSKMLLNSSDISQVVPLMHFETTETTLKNGNIVKRLQAVTTQANMEFLVNFITTMLPNIVYHRNHLRHYRSNIGEFHQAISRITFLRKPVCTCKVRAAKFTLEP